MIFAIIIVTNMSLVGDRMLALKTGQGRDYADTFLKNEDFHNT